MFYRSKRPPQDALRKRIRELAMTRVRYGYKRIHVLLKREGIHVNKKRVHRLYCLEGLQIRPRRPRRSVSAARRQPPKVAARLPNEAWSMDFVADQTSQGNRFRMLTIIDVFTRECLAIEVGQKLNGEDVARTLARIVRRKGRRKGSTATMAASSAVVRWIFGLTRIRCLLSFLDRENRQTMHLSNRSMAAYGTSV